MTRRRKILITGGSGQVGSQLLRLAPDQFDVHAPKRDALDIADMSAIRACVENLRPDVIINAAAYTAVDRAESDALSARTANAGAPAALAEAAARTGARLVQLSTDFVFDGESSVPYLPGDRTNPLSVYGASKQQGEAAVQAALAEAQYLIIRTAWVHAPSMNNFAASILRLLKERGHLSVVADQFGTPTSAENLARAIWNGVELGGAGIVHFTDAGAASWYDFAAAIMRLGKRSGRLAPGASIQPIPASAYPTAAKRPRFAVLDKTSGWAALGAAPEHWQDALERTWFGGPA